MQFLNEKKVNSVKSMFNHSKKEKWITINVL